LPCDLSVHRDLGAAYALDDCTHKFTCSSGIPSAAEAALFFYLLTDGLKPIPFKTNTSRSV
jgi:hypothetical protein